MRVMFTVSSWRGHYFCMIPLGWALQAAGHDVRVTCAPDQVEPVSRAGLTAVPVLHSADWMTMLRLNAYLQVVRGERTGSLPLHPLTGERVARLEEFDPVPATERFAKQTRDAMCRSFDGTIAFARTWRPDLVLHDLTAPEGMAAAELLGVPSVYHPPGLYGTAETEPGLDFGDGDGDKSKSFSRYGLEPFTTRRIRHAVDPSPDVSAPPMGSTLRLPIRYVPYNGMASVPGWLHEPSRKRRVTILWGSSAASEPDAETALRAAVDGARAQNAEVLLTTTPAQAEALGPLPGGVRPLTSFPLNLLLSVSDAVIHHGSVNTLMTAAALGVPQLPMPFTREQIAVSDRIRGTGAALPLPALTSTPDEIADGVAKVLGDPAYAAAADRLRDVIAAQPSPADAVRPLEVLVRKGTLDHDDLTLYTSGASCAACTVRR